MEQHPPFTKTVSSHLTFPPFPPYLSHLLLTGSCSICSSLLVYALLLNKSLLVSCSHMLRCPPKAALSCWAAPPSPHCPWAASSGPESSSAQGRDFSTPPPFLQGSYRSLCLFPSNEKITLSLVTFQENFPSYPWTSPQPAGRKT